MISIKGRVEYVDFHPHECVAYVFRDYAVRNVVTHWLVVDTPDGAELLEDKFDTVEGAIAKALVIAEEY